MSVRRPVCPCVNLPTSIKFHQRPSASAHPLPLIKTLLQVEVMIALSPWAMLYADAH